MSDKIQHLKLVWDSINIQITYNPDYSEVFREVYGRPLAHLEIESENRQRLPMTETGYRSHFTAAAEIEAYGTPVDFVELWLEETAKNKEWQEYKKERQQLSLF